VTDPGGLFTLDRVPPGTIVLRARADAPDGPRVGVASAVLAVESAQDLRVEVRKPGTVRGRLVAESGALPAGLRVVLQPTLLRPSALYPAGEAAVDPDGGFEASGTVGEHELIVQGLPQGWALRGKRPLLWLDAAETINDVRVEIANRR
jgi:hypothetical protein